MEHKDPHDETHSDTLHLTPAAESASVLVLTRENRGFKKRMSMYEMTSCRITKLCVDTEDGENL